MLRFALLAVMVTQASCGKKPDGQSFIDRQQSVGDQYAEATKDLPKEIPEKLNQPIGIVDDKASAPTPIEIMAKNQERLNESLKAYWGDFSDDDFSDANMGSRFQTIVNRHWDTKVNGSLPDILGLEYVLLNSRPAQQLMTLQVANKLGLAFDAIDRSQTLGLVEQSEYSKAIQDKRLKTKEIMAIQRSIYNDFKLEGDKSEQSFNQLINGLFRLSLTKTQAAPPPSYANLIRLSGVLRGLDPHSRIASLENASSQRDASKSVDWVGVGIEGKLDERGIRVYGFISGSGARAAGMRYGDRIIAIEGETFPSGDAKGEWAEKLLGELGTSVKVTVLRNGRSREIEIKRSRVQIANVELGQIQNGPTVVKLRQFIDVGLDPGSTEKGDSSTWIHEALDGRSDQSAPIILDFRNNPGGYMHVATQLMELFDRVKDPGKASVSSLFGFDPTGKPLFGKQTLRVPSAAEGAPFKNVPLVVLINEGSASASELVSEFFANQHRAIVIGKRSLGKGTFQGGEPMNTDKGGSTKLQMFITGGFYVLGEGTCPQKRGVRPHIDIDAGDEQVDAASNYQEDDYFGVLESPETKLATTSLTPTAEFAAALKCSQDQVSLAREQYRLAQLSGSGIVDQQLIMAKIAAECLVTAGYGRAADLAEFVGPPAPVDLAKQP